MGQLHNSNGKFIYLFPCIFLPFEGVDEKWSEFQTLTNATIRCVCFHLTSYSINSKCEAFMPLPWPTHGSQGRIRSKEKKVGRDREVAGSQVRSPPPTLPAHSQVPIPTDYHGRRICDPTESSSTSQYPDTAWNHAIALGFEFWTLQPVSPTCVCEHTTQWPPSFLMNNPTNIHHL